MMKLQIPGLAWCLFWAVSRCVSSRRIHELWSFDRKLYVLLVYRYFIMGLGPRNYVCLYKWKNRSCRFIGLVYERSLFPRFDTGSTSLGEPCKTCDRIADYVVRYSGKVQLISLRIRACTSTMDKGLFVSKEYTPKQFHGHMLYSKEQKWV